MTLDKPSKWSDWKSRFYLVKAPTNKENREFRTYNRKPELLGQKCRMPPVPERDREAILDSHFFELVPSTLSTGEVIRVPRNWVPKHEFLRDEAFLSACGLSSMFEKQEAKNMLPIEKTPARKASDICKENLEKKHVAQAAKKDGSKAPRSLQKQIRPRPTVVEPASKVQKTTSAARPSTGGKSIKTPGGSTAEVVASREVTPIRTSTGPSTDGGLRGLQQQGTNPFNLALFDLPMRVKSYSQSQPGDSPISRQSIGGAYAAFSPSVSGADNSPRWPDVAQYARAMLKAVPREKKEAIPGINTFNADRVMVELADALLRVEGLKKAYIRKREKVRSAKRLADDAHNVAEYSMIVHDLETKSIIMRQADQVKTLQKALNESKVKFDNVKVALDNAEKELKEHEEPFKRMDQAEKASTRLQQENDRLIKEAAATKGNFQATLEAEQSRLIEENEQDCENRMKRAFSIIHPGTDYNVWELAYKYVDLAILAEEENQPGPEYYEKWVEAKFKRIDEEAAANEEAIQDEVAPGSVPIIDPSHPEGTQAPSDRVTVQIE
ncbi:uncharacterized protein LOC110685171 isoform X2 [Chenopodium quinoa]|uniref:uncharacterized protein LOC110685171 isoform X2 n=1 Tax=Chenopodium quinoa TaxID=63459 RepID=UPI000B7797E9|nr:uncharacterized protein LOC110685171 isoform X2 [Chenopodium quinoa]